MVTHACRFETQRAERETGGVPGATTACPLHEKGRPANTPRIRHVAFAVDDVDAVVAVRACGGELVGEVEQYEDRYRLCYVRRPEAIIVKLAERIG
jgi:hypothetical protein